MKLVNKDKVKEILRNLWKEDDGHNPEHRVCYNKALQEVQCEIDTLEVKDLYEQCVQYSSIEDGIKAHAETYSFNIESELFNQLTKEQQALWRKEIEQACISGGNAGIELARDIRYKENVEVKDVEIELQGLEKEVAEGYVEKINNKRIPISLKGEKKAKFKNEFNTLWQTINYIQFANVAKPIIERLCLHFAAWGVYNLKGIGQIDKDEKKKMDVEVKDVDLKKESELIANSIMISVQVNKYHTCVYNTERYDFNHSHLMLAARKGIELGLSTRQKGE